VLRVASVDALVQAAAGFVVTDLDLAAEPAAVAAAQRSLDESGPLLLGEVHGARENPLLARTLMQAFGLTGLALEWDEEDLSGLEDRWCGGRPDRDWRFSWSAGSWCA
jgi:hypothetical protein